MSKQRTQEGFFRTWSLIILAIVILVGGYYLFNREGTTPIPMYSPSPSNTTEVGNTPTPTTPKSVGNDKSLTDLLRFCPEKWFANKIPKIYPETIVVPNEYFVHQGRRLELSEVDLNWVKTNCSVKQEYVQ